MSIKLDNVTYKYNSGTEYETYALKNISVQIDQGEFIGVLGHTGSGKSTLIQHFNALLKPTSGDIFYNGKNIWEEAFDRRELRFNVGLVFQYPEYQFFETSVINDVCFGPRNRGFSDEEAYDAAADALKAVGVSEDIYRKSPFEISGGVKRRVAIAGVLAMNPNTLVLDEPTAGLDPKGRRAILALLSDLHKNRGITIILVSHNMEDIAEYAKRIIVLNKGSVAFDGSANEVFSHYTELEKMSLSAPAVTYILNALRKRGLDVDTSAITVTKAKESILKALGRSRIC